MAPGPSSPAGSFGPDNKASGGTVDDQVTNTVNTLVRVRIRPANQREDKNRSCLQLSLRQKESGGNSSAVTFSSHDGSMINYEFDKVYGEMCLILLAYG